MSKVFEREGDFESPVHREIEASLERRPDAISQSKLTAFSLGPSNIEDLSRGLTDRSWRIRAVPAEDEFCNSTTKILLDRWTTPAIELFDIGVFCDEPHIRNVREIDLAFDQEGRPVVAVELNTSPVSIWLYHHNSPAIFERITNGVSPRIALDIPLVQAKGLNDLQLFYVRSNTLRQRVQRENYSIEHEPRNLTASFVEQSYFSGFRFHVVYSIRDASEGTYTYEVLSSDLLSITPEVEALSFRSQIRDIELHFENEVTLIAGPGIVLNPVSGLGFGIIGGPGIRITPSLGKIPGVFEGPGIRITEVP